MISYDANKLIVKITSNLDHIRKWYTSLRSKLFLPMSYCANVREREREKKEGGGRGGGEGREKRKVFLFFPPPPPSFLFCALFTTFWTNLRGNACLQATKTPSTIKSMVFIGSSHWHT